MCQQQQGVHSIRSWQQASMTAESPDWYQGVHRPPHVQPQQRRQVLQTQLVSTKPSLLATLSSLFDPSQPLVWHCKILLQHFLSMGGTEALLVNYPAPDINSVASIRPPFLNPTMCRELHITGLIVLYEPSNLKRLIKQAKSAHYWQQQQCSAQLSAASCSPCVTMGNHYQHP
jgi:hypothetical protein